MDISGQRFRFGPYESRPESRELYKHGFKLKVRPQPLQVLNALLSRAGDVVTREDLRRRLWSSETFVDFEHSLYTSVKEIRAVLGDSAEEPRYIQTLPKLGYRFIAPVEVVESAAAAVAPPPAAPAIPDTPDLIVPTSDAPAAASVGQKPRSWTVAVAAAAALVVALTAGAYFLHLRRAARPQPGISRSVLAVLPFENLTGDPAQDYLSDGLTEEMIAQLGRLDPAHLGVIARTSVMHYKNSPEPLEQIGRELGVQYVLEGSVRRDSDKVRISAQLIQLQDQTHLWSRQYDRELSSLLTLQGEIAQEIADEIQLTLGGDRKRPPDRTRATSTASFEAYDLYLKGRYFWNKRSQAGFQQAADYFRQAVAKDPDYAPAYSGLADTLALMSSWHQLPQMEAMPNARAAALTALQLDETLSEAHTSLALIAEIYDYDWPTAEKEYKRAIELDPGYATAHQWYAECLSFEGRFDEAFAESERARQLDPLSLIIATDHAAILYYSRQYDRAIEQFRSVLEMQRDSPRAHMIVSAYVEKGRFEDALADIQNWTEIPESNPYLWGSRAYVYGRWSRREEARRALARFGQVIWNAKSDPILLRAQVYTAVGRKDDAISILQRAYGVHSDALVTLKVEPGFDSLRTDPRFQDLLHRVGLAQ